MAIEINLKEDKTPRGLKLEQRLIDNAFRGLSQALTKKSNLPLEPLQDETKFITIYEEKQDEFPKQG